VTGRRRPTSCGQLIGLPLEPDRLGPQRLRRSRAAGCGRRVRREAPLTVERRPGQQCALPSSEPDGRNAALRPRRGQLGRVRSALCSAHRFGSTRAAIRVVQAGWWADVPNPVFRPWGRDSPGFRSVTLADGRRARLPHPQTARRGGYEASAGGEGSPSLVRAHKPRARSVARCGITTGTRVARRL
jgi:hypothetical protein